jgi:hypothetical protein
MGAPVIRGILTQMDLARGETGRLKQEKFVDAVSTCPRH